MKVSVTYIHSTWWHLLIFILMNGCASIGLQAQDQDIDASLERGKKLYQTGNYQEATVLFSELIAQACLDGNTKALGKLYYQLGHFYAEQGSNQRSLDMLLSSSELLEPAFASTRSNIIAPPLNKSPKTYTLSMPEDASMICEVYNKVGSLYFRQGNYPKAKRYWRKAYRVAQQHNNAKALSTAYNNLGEIRRVSGQLDTALLYYRRALSIKTYIQDSAGMHINWNNIGAIYLERGQLDSAKHSYDQSYQLAQHINTPKTLAISSLNYGDYYLQKQQPKPAIAWFHRALELCTAINDLHTCAHAHQQLAMIHEGYQRLDSCVYHQREYQLLRQAMHRTDREKLTMQIEAEYLVHEKEKELLQVRQAAALKQEQTRLMDLIQWGSLLFMALLLLVAFFVLRWRKQHETELKAHLQHIEAQNDEKGILLKEIHHRVKNNLQVITSLLSLQSLSIDDPLTKDLFQQSQQRINSMSMIHQMLYQSDQLATINYRDYLERLVYGLVATNRGEPYEIQLELDIPPICLSVDTAIPLGLLVNEIVTNALKYGLDKGSDSRLSLNLKALAEPDTYELRIGDNGRGIAGDWKKASPSTSLGLRLIQQLSRQLQGSIERDETQIGMHYVLRFKEIHPSA